MSLCYYEQDLRTASGGSAAQGISSNNLEFDVWDVKYGGMPPYSSAGICDEKTGFCKSKGWNNRKYFNNSVKRLETSEFNNVVNPIFQKIFNVFFAFFIIKFQSQMRESSKC